MAPGIADPLVFGKAHTHPHNNLYPGGRESMSVRTLISESRPVPIFRRLLHCMIDTRWVTGVGPG